MESVKESKWLYILLSVAIAVGFWMFVRLGEDPETDTTVRDIPVNIVGERVLENQGLILTGISSNTVDLSWKGSFSTLRQLMEKDSVSVTLDVSRISEPGVHELEYDINYPSAVASYTVSLQDSNPKTITVTVAKYQSRSFVIQPVFRGSVAEGYQAKDFLVSPESVQITGTEEEIAQIASVQVLLEQEELSESFTGDLPLILLDHQGDVIQNSNLRMSTETAYATLPVVAVKEVELTVEFTPGGGATTDNINYKIEPLTITVSGPAEDMQYLDKVSLGNIDLSKVMGTSVQECPIYLPSGIENVSGISTASVRITIRGLVTKEFEVDNIQITHEPEGLNASLSTQVRTIVVRGPAESLEQVFESQISVVVDLSGYTATGSYSVPAKVYLSGSSDVGVIGEYNVVVNISR